MGIVVSDKDGSSSRCRKFSAFSRAAEVLAAAGMAKRWEEAIWVRDGRCNGAFKQAAMGRCQSRRREGLVERRLQAVRLLVLLKGKQSFRANANRGGTNVHGNGGGRPFLFSVAGGHFLERPPTVIFKRNKCRQPDGVQQLLFISLNMVDVIALATVA